MDRRQARVVVRRRKALCAMQALKLKSIVSSDRIDLHPSQRGPVVAFPMFELVPNA